MSLYKPKDDRARRWLRSLCNWFFGLISRYERLHQTFRHFIFTANVLRSRIKARNERIKAWTASVWLCACVTGFALIINLSMLIWASTSFPSVSGVGTLLEGSCSRVSSWDTWLHLLINALSTILLGASNYTMQCLSAPDRSELDAAHAQGKSMDIGVPSFGNLRRIDWRRTMAWVLLAITSVPTSLVYVGY